MQFFQRDVGMDFASSVGVQALDPFGVKHMAWKLRTKKHPKKLGGDEARFDDHTLFLGGGNSNILYLHPENWGRWTHFDSYFSDGVETTNQFFSDHTFFFGGSVTLSRFLWKSWVWRGEFAAKKGISNKRMFLIEIFGEASCETKTFFLLQLESCKLPAPQLEINWFCFCCTLASTYIGGRGNRKSWKKIDTLDDKPRFTVGY